MHYSLFHVYVIRVSTYLRVQGLLNNCSSRKHASFPAKCILHFLSKPFMEIAKSKHHTLVAAIPRCNMLLHFPMAKALTIFYNLFKCEYTKAIISSCINSPILFFLYIIFDRMSAKLSVGIFVRTLYRYHRNIARYTLAYDDTFLRQYATAKPPYLLYARPSD